MITIRSYPKVNCTLDILGKSERGYHEMQTIFYQLAAPFDELTFEDDRTGIITIGCDDPTVPTDERNTVMHAALLLKEKCGAERGVSEKGARIFIKKNIPVGGGLGGGSSNAVAALRGLAQLWELDVGPTFFKKIAEEIGMDCGFFLNGGTAFAEHFGEKITQLKPLPRELKCEIIPTGIEVSSAWAYQNIDLQKCGKNRDKTKKMIKAITAGDTQGVLENLHNDFEELIFSAHPELLQKKHEAAKMHAQKSEKIMLCGSGGSLARVFIDAN